MAYKMDLREIESFNDHKTKNKSPGAEISSWGIWLVNVYPDATDYQNLYLI